MSNQNRITKTNTTNNNILDINKKSTHTKKTLPNASIGMFKELVPEFNNEIDHTEDFTSKLSKEFDENNVMRILNEKRNTKKISEYVKKIPGLKKFIDFYNVPSYEIQEVCNYFEYKRLSPYEKFQVYNNHIILIFKGSLRLKGNKKTFNNFLKKALKIDNEHNDFNDKTLFGEITTSKIVKDKNLYFEAGIEETHILMLSNEIYINKLHPLVFQKKQQIIQQLSLVSTFIKSADSYTKESIYKQFIPRFFYFGDIVYRENQNANLLYFILEGSFNLFNNALNINLIRKEKNCFVGLDSIEHCKNEAIEKINAFSNNLSDDQSNIFKKLTLLKGSVVKYSTSLKCISSKGILLELDLSKISSKLFLKDFSKSLIPLYNSNVKYFEDRMHKKDILNAKMKIDYSHNNSNGVLLNNTNLEISNTDQFKARNLKNIQETPKNTKLNINFTKCIPKTKIELESIKSERSISNKQVTFRFNKKRSTIRKLKPITKHTKLNINNSVNLEQESNKLKKQHTLYDFSTVEYEGNRKLTNIVSNKKTRTLSIQTIDLDKYINHRVDHKSTYSIENEKLITTHLKQKSLNVNFSTLEVNTGKLTLPLVSSYIK